MTPETVVNKIIEDEAKVILDAIGCANNASIDLIICFCHRLPLGSEILRKFFSNKNSPIVSGGAKNYHIFWVMLRILAFYTHFILDRNRDARS